MSSSPSTLSDPLLDASERFNVTGPEVKESSEPARSATEPLKPALYYAVWRWHFFAGLIVTPILLIASVTGALYVFKAELSDWLYADLYFVEPTGERLSFEDQQRVAREAAGDLELEGLILSTEANRSSQFVAHIHEGGDANPRQMHRVFFIDPYSGRLLGSQVLEREFFGVVLELHRTLLGGVPGRIVVELATCWGLVLLGTGIYLWWPRGKKRVEGVWVPRIRGKLYAVLRDWHAVSGMYFMPLAVLILGTGLFFSQIWGTGYFFLIDRAGQVPPEVFGPYPSPAASSDHTPAALDLVVNRMFEQSRPGDKLFIQLSPSADVAHKAFLMSGDNHNTMRVVAVDRQTGETLDVTDAAELPPMLRLYALAVSIHTGVVLGLSSKILAFLTCLALIALTLTGLVMWWKRRPPGRLGAPRATSVKLPTWIGGLIVLTGLALPALGLSLLLIVAGDRLAGGFLRRRAPTL